MNKDNHTILELITFYLSKKNKINKKVELDVSEYINQDNFDDTLNLLYNNKHFKISNFKIKNLKENMLYDGEIVKIFNLENFKYLDHHTKNIFIMNLNDRKMTFNLLIHLLTLLTVINYINFEKTFIIVITIQDIPITINMDRKNVSILKKLLNNANIDVLLYNLIININNLTSIVDKYNEKKIINNLKNEDNEYRKIITKYISEGED